jgi:hypothetical protein
MHVVVPVIPSEEEETQKGEGGSGDAAHLTATKATTARSGWPPAVAILRLSVHRRGLGAMHVVLESMHCDPPYLLENRTRFPLQYRQVGGRRHTLPLPLLPACRNEGLPRTVGPNNAAEWLPVFCAPPFLQAHVRPAAFHTLEPFSAGAVLPLHRQDC